MLNSWPLAKEHGTGEIVRFSAAAAAGQTLHLSQADPSENTRLKATH